MITLDLGHLEYYDATKNEFVYIEGGVVDFEYSLNAVFAWEGKWKKPFLKGELDEIELLDFYKTMALQPIDERFITHELMVSLSKYISEPNTATTFHDVQGGQNGDINGKAYTSEELYGLMFISGIPIEFESRNLNRLLTILRVISAKNSPPKKLNKEEVLKQNAQLNAERKKKLQSKG